MRPRMSPMKFMDSIENTSTKVLPSFSLGRVVV